MISEFSVSDSERLVQNEVIKGDMIPKVDACVRTVVAERPHHRQQEAHAILLELPTDE
jgi:acetylglutamate kinase